MLANFIEAFHNLKLSAVYCRKKDPKLYTLVTFFEFAKGL